MAAIPLPNYLFYDNLSPGSQARQFPFYPIIYFMTKLRQSRSLQQRAKHAKRGKVKKGKWFWRCSHVELHQKHIQYLGPHGLQIGVEKLCVVVVTLWVMSV